jgi:hypothetical protein
MFDHLDASASVTQHGTAGNFDPVCDPSGNTDGWVEISADEDNSVVGGCGPKNDAHVAAAPEPKTFHTCGPGDRLLPSRPGRQRGIIFCNQDEHRIVR